MSHGIIPDSAGTPLFIALICVFVVGTFIVAFSLEFLSAEQRRVVRTARQRLFDSQTFRRNRSDPEVAMEPDSRKEKPTVQPSSGRHWPQLRLRRRWAARTKQGAINEAEPGSPTALEDGKAA